MQKKENKKSSSGHIVLNKWPHQINVLIKLSGTVVSFRLGTLAAQYEKWDHVHLGEKIVIESNCKLHNAVQICWRFKLSYYRVKQLLFFVLVGKWWNIEVLFWKAAIGKDKRVTLFKLFDLLSALCDDIQEKARVLELEEEANVVLSLIERDFPISVL